MQSTARASPRDLTESSSGVRTYSPPMAGQARFKNRLAGYDGIEESRHSFTNESGINSAQSAANKSGVSREKEACEPGQAPCRKASSEMTRQSGALPLRGAPGPRT